LKPKAIIASLLAILVLVFVVQNTEVVAVRLLFWDFRMSRVLLILLTTVIGFVGGYIVANLVKSK
jgi:uncharacterized integral membrane protein